MKITFNTELFKKQMDNMVDYSFGFLDGIDDGKTILTLTKTIITTIFLFTKNQMLGLNKWEKSVKKLEKWLLALILLF